jgi:uncharacterized cupin superfamily protein
MMIQKLDFPSTAASSVLEDWATVGLPLSEPACQLRGVKMVLPIPNQPEVGLWECSPGRYRRQVRSSETMHVISGEAVFTPDGGSPVSLKPGDVYFFPPETVGIWEIKTAMRKVYVLFHPVQPV